MTSNSNFYHIAILVSALVILTSAEAFSRNPNRQHNSHRDTTATQLKEFVITSNRVKGVRASAFNAASVSTKGLKGTASSIGDALGKAPGMKLREAGGAGSDLSISMDGFNGKHVKVFIDGVPQEGEGAAMALNNIPADYAERIEVYRGVVPVQFGADAIGGVVNIVTAKRRKSMFASGNYTLGSFNTHKGNLNFGQNFESGLRYEINAFGNWSDNNYRIQTSVEDFNTGAINRRKKESVTRFNDAFGSVALQAKVGVTNKPWADRLFFGIRGSQTYKEIQNGVRQEIVYGEKHRHSRAFSPWMEYAKRDFFTEGLQFDANLRYRYSGVENVDTASRKYNWHGESAPHNSPGEQSYLHAKAINHNTIGNLTFTYRFADAHTLTLNNLFNSFERTNRNLLTPVASYDEFNKSTLKDIAGLSYRYAPNSLISFTAFGKGYFQHLSGPVATTATASDYRLESRSTSSIGYGAAGSYSFPIGFLLKASYEKALRLPSIEELFGNEDLELGEFSLRPESSHNINLGVGYNLNSDNNSISADLGLIYRDTRDYIQRNLLALSGGKSAASYTNYGRVLTRGISLSARYNYARILSIGGNFSHMNILDNMATVQGTSASNPSYRERIPNVPWMFADFDANLYWHGLGGKKNTMTLTYDNRYTHSFSYYASNIGSNPADYMVPNQFSHNLTLSYSMANGRYGVSLECRNLTDAALYDNFSLQKPGRAFYATLRFSM